MSFLSSIVKRTILAEAPEDTQAKPAVTVAPAKKRRVKFVYRGYVYFWFPDEVVFEITAGPRYARRSRPTRVAEGDKQFASIMSQYRRFRARVRSGLYPTISPGMTNAETGGALGRIILAIKTSPWFKAAGSEASALSSVSSSTPDLTYDGGIVQAVQSFQKSAGLSPDGVIGMTTHDAIITAAQDGLLQGSLGTAAKASPRSDAASGAAPSEKPVAIKTVDEVVPTMKRMGYGELHETKYRPDRLIIIVDGKRQRISVRRFAENSEVASFPCSTSRVGFGNRPPNPSHDAAPTATGLMRVYRKVGAGMPIGTVFKAREPVADFNDDGKPNQPDDLAPRRGGNPAQVVTRIILVEGLQDENSGSQSVKDRNIYFHGTNVEEMIGRPASGGCIRMLNDDVIKLFEMVEVGDLAYIIGSGGGDTPPLPPPTIDAMLRTGRYGGRTGIGTVKPPTMGT